MSDEGAGGAVSGGGGAQRRLITLKLPDIHPMWFLALGLGGGSTTATVISHLVRGDIAGAAEAVLHAQDAEEMAEEETEPVPGRLYKIQGAVYRCTPTGEDVTTVSEDAEHWR